MELAKNATKLENKYLFHVSEVANLLTKKTYLSTNMSSNRNAYARAWAHIGRVTGKGTFGELTSIR
jgi:hypothetical protein